MTSIYAAIIAYAIVKYRLMDIRLAVTNAGIFFVVYAVSFGLPFYLMARGHQWLALGLLAVLASGAPFIYARLKRQAEDRLFEEQKRYQEVLLQASKGLTKFKTVDDIARFIVTILTKAVRIKSVAFYLHDGWKYVLKGSAGDEKFSGELADTGPATDFLKGSGAILVDELKQGEQGNAAGGAAEFFRKHPAHVVVPVIRDGKVLGIVFLGEKVDSIQYSERDLTVLNVIADQTALAMENAAHLEATRKDFIEQMHDRRLKDIGLLGSTISHQMCNRLQKITLGLEYAQSVFDARALESDTREALVAKLKECLGDFEVMKEDAFSAAEISDALMTFSKSGNEPSAVLLKRAVKMAKDLVDAKHRGFVYGFAEEYDEKIALWANVSAVQDVLFNAFDNSLDAVKVKMASGSRPEDYAPRISVKAHANGDMATVEVLDNGVGFRPENLEKVFIPFFTTKGTTEGTGLGLHAMRELVRRNGGDITVASEFSLWAKVTINLPLARGEGPGTAGK